MSQPRILIVEDDNTWQKLYRRALKDADYDITPARTVNKAMDFLEKQSFDVVITDLNMLGGGEEFSGFGVLEQAQKINPDTQTIVITGYGSADHAIRTMGSGAYDYITKDRKLAKKLALSVQSALEIQQLLRGELEDDVEAESDRIIGNSDSMRVLFGQIFRVANNEVNVLLQGESGTGKRLIAQTIHLQSQRKGGPFLVVDCGRLSEAVVESELFGYEAGLLYGDGRGHLGKFERANQGTIFLDGIGDLDMRLQRRLIGAIRDRVVERVGGKKPIPIQARIIASTDKNLDDLMSQKRFDRRLFHAVNESVIQVPPLRQRKDGDDIPLIAAMFLQRHGQSRQITFSTDVIQLLRRYDYPGNVRELESTIKYALTMTNGTVIHPEHLPPEIRQTNRPKAAETKDPRTILRVCPLNMEACSKKDEIIRLYSPQRIFVNLPDLPEYEEYEQAIRQTLESYGLIPILPKDHLESIALFCNNCKLIQTCKYGITDISTPETDVLHKLGHMHAVGVRCALLKERRAKPAADHLQGLFFLEYTNPTTLSEQLIRWIEGQIKEIRLVRTSSGDPPILPDLAAEEIKNLKQLILQHRSNLHKLKMQAALYSISDLPLRLQHDIENEELRIQELEELLELKRNEGDE